MIAMRMTSVKRGFFDRPAVLAAMERGQRKALSRFGAFVRQRARSSIRPRTGTSTPGQPPHSHTGLLRRNIFFAYDPGQHGVVIGPVALNRATNAPQLLEEGGVTLRRRNGRLQRLQFSPRPFMRPAFAIELKRLPPLWLRSVR